MAGKSEIMEAFDAAMGTLHGAVAPGMNGDSNRDALRQIATGMALMAEANRDAFERIWRDLRTLQEEVKKLKR